MQTSSFTIKFRRVDESAFDPTNPATVGYWLDVLQREGAEVEQLAEDCYVIRCCREAQLQRIGWIILRTSLANLADVTEVGGLAQRAATAYSPPPRKRHGK
jgi:hypothetical protein